MGKIWSDKTIEAFFTLLRGGLEEKDIEYPLILSEKEWEDIVYLASTQTVTGLVFRGVSHLPDGNDIPGQVLMKLMKKADGIARASARISEIRTRLDKVFNAEGLRPVVMKGPEVATFYLHPELRECGDLDLYFPGSAFDKAVSTISSLGIGIMKSPDGSVRYLFDGIWIDQHRRYYDLRRRGLPEVPSPYATLLMLSAHILKHCMTSGVGLRQICDMAVAYRSLEGSYSKPVLAGIYSSAGLEQWNRLLASFLSAHLGCNSHPYSPDSLPPPDPLMDIILEGGNFGHHADGRADAEKSSALRRKTDTVRRILKRLPFSLKYGRKEFFGYMADLVRGNL